MLFDEGIDIVKEYATFYRRGTALYYDTISVPYDSEADNLDSIKDVMSNNVIMDKNIPIFKEDRYFIEKYVFIEEDDE